MPTRAIMFGSNRAVGSDSCFGQNLSTHVALAPALRIINVIDLLSKTRMFVRYVLMLYVLVHKQYSLCTLFVFDNLTEFHLFKSLSLSAFDGYDSHSGSESNAPAAAPHSLGIHVLRFRRLPLRPDFRTG